MKAGSTVYKLSLKVAKKIKGVAGELETMREPLENYLVAVCPKKQTKDPRMLENCT